MRFRAVDMEPESPRARATIAALARACAVLLLCLACVEGTAFAVAVPARPIPEGETDAARFTGAPAEPKPLTSPAPPRHPFMAPNARSNLHNDAYASDVYFSQLGPLGRDMRRRSTFQAADCASLAFDSRDRVVSICVGLDRPRLLLFDPQTLATLAEFDLPPRDATAGNPFSGFSGGGYFYLDGQDRTITPTTNRQVWVIGERSTPAGPAFALERVYDLSTAVRPGDQIVSALPDYDGRIWFVSAKGVVGTIARATGVVRSRTLADERIGNSFSVDENGGVYIVSDRAMYRFDATAAGYPKTSWREVYDNDGQTKPSQVTAGSGTTPTLMGDDLVSIADNADPIKATFYKRGRNVRGRRLVCSEPLFERGRSATENSFIGTRSSIVAENNYGYTGPKATQMGRSTAPGLTRVDVDRRSGECRTAWESMERAPSVVPKLSLPAGLVYTYTKPPRPREGDDPWYFTALDFRTGRTVYERLAGEGLGYNNNYAPISIGPDRSAYVGALGGLVRLFDTGGSTGGGGGPAGGGDCGGRSATITGTSGNDELRGTPGNDVISAGGGNDSVRAEAGNDLVCGDSGNDVLEGGAGDDTLDGGSGNDRLDGGADRDRCLAGSGADRRTSCEG